MTVCVSALCEAGKYAVSATDGLLSLGGVDGDTIIAKAHWIDDWLVMYAGEPSNEKMIFEEFHQVVNAPLTRDNIQGFVREAYQRRKARWLTARVLSPYDMTLEEFKKEGLAMFGENEFRRLSQSLGYENEEFGEQLIVVGWGAVEHAAMLYSIDTYGDRDSAWDGIAAIGSGRDIALSTLLLLGQGRHQSLAETIYSVAAAKFSAEKSQGKYVGERTFMCISRKRTSADDDPKIMLVESEIATLRKLWEEYGKPRIPAAAWNQVTEICQNHDLELTRTMMHMTKAFAKKSPE